MIENTGTPNDVIEFYETVAPFYDDMTGFERRFVVERPFFRMLVERYTIGSAVDAGCGTGFHSFLLSQLGVLVLGVDASHVMIANANRHAKELNSPVNFHEGDFQTLAQDIAGKYDAVFCLGNSLSHLLHDDEIIASLANFASLLKPGGHLFVQILNYDRILAKKERVQFVKDVGNTTFVRFYDYEQKLIRFNVLRLEKNGETIVDTLVSVLLRPLRKVELETMLRRVGLTDSSCFGGISLEQFVPETSKDLFIIAKA